MVVDEPDPNISRTLQVHSGPMTEWTRTARVLHRACFGASGAEIDAAVATGIGRWLDGALADAPAPTYPSFPVVAEPGKNATQEERKKYREALNDQGKQLTTWWVKQMATTAHPAQERILFGWHQHWATSISKVKLAPAMLLQHQTLRRTSLGSFTTMTSELVKDPALMYYLDAQQNTKAAPNENLARELMELFCLGVGSGYTETDVKEAARALTGWKLDDRVGASFDPKRHDDGSKTLLGVTGRLDTQGAVETILAAKAHPVHVATRWWHHLASPEGPSAETLSRLLAAYGPGRDLRALFRALYTDPEFDKAAGAMVLSPVEWVVGTLRTLKIPASDQVIMAALATLRSLGQLPLQPPNVSGWPSGQAWLSTASAQTRAGAAQRLAKAADLAPIANAKAASRPEALAHLLGLEKFTPRTLAALDTAKGDPVRLTAIALVSPEYQVA